MLVEVTNLNLGKTYRTLWHLLSSPISTTICFGNISTTKNQQQGAVQMNRKELIEALAKKTDSTKADAERNIASLIEIITATLKKGDSISLVGFGSFEVRKRAARVGRNPKTGAELKIKASKVPAFKAGATLKAAVNGGKK